MLLNLCYMLQSGLVLEDDIHACPVPGIDQFSMLGASGEADVPGLGFRYDTNQACPTASTMAEWPQA